ncbi:hypothetical protein GALL_71470 [mine drainage metagenome]|uniref:Uncharacterized protein n=1 Tax=mine drainage metagenome TaxID=410659 RepID=A0A1J5T3Z9_9ZZZZ
MTQFVFGAGDFYGVPLYDASGNAIANPTPVKVGTMQEMSLDFSADIKEAYGQYSFAVAVARGKTKLSGKFKGLQINGNTLSGLFFGNGLAAGTLMAAYSDTTGASIPATPFQITVAPPGSGVWANDLGVIDSNGVAMTAVASAPATGQYSVGAGGVYTFAAADTGKQVFINYAYTATNASAKKIAVTNLPMGYAPTFKSYMKTTYQGKNALVVLYSTISSKLALLGTKLDDYSAQEIDFSGQANASGQVCDIYVQE